MMTTVCYLHSSRVEWQHKMTMMS